MYKYFQRFLKAVTFGLVAGCQTTTGDNLFRVQPSDASITTAVTQALHNDESVSRLKLHVQTSNGVVMLSGHARTIRQSDRADELATKIEGVKSVQNKIVVRRR